MRSRRTLALVAAIIAAGMVSPLGAYLKLGTSVGNQILGIKWTHQPIRYFVTNRDVSGVTAPQLQTALAGALAEWSGQANVTISSQFVGFTGADPFNDDGVSVIGFQARPDLDRTLGATTFDIDDVTGEILAADIFLNSSFSWSVAANGTASRFDVASVLTHEVGHLLGLGHSALGETQAQAGGGRTVLGKRAVMFPIAFPPGSIKDRTIEPDDVSGITDIYGTATAKQELGAISGRVTLNGAGVLGAHVRPDQRIRAELEGGVRHLGHAGRPLHRARGTTGRCRPGQFLRRRHARRHELPGHLFQPAGRRAGRRHERND
jgi:predicted Zn-dependent protease